MVKSSLEERIGALEIAFDRMANLVQPLILEFEIRRSKERAEAKSICENLSKKITEGQTMGVWDE
jgi:hypothetical protein